MPCRLTHVLIAVSVFFNLAAVHAGEPIRVACVGASTTYGSNLNDRERECYPAQLQRRLGAQFEVRNFGCPSYCLSRNSDKSYWKTRQFGEAKEFEPKIVVIQLGSNDGKSKSDWESCRKDFAKSLVDMVQDFRGLPSKPEVFFCLPGPIPKYKTWNSILINQVTPLIRKTCKEKRIPTIDFFGPLKGRDDLMNSDGIHPNAQGARIIATKVYAAINKLDIVKSARSKDKEKNKKQKRKKPARNEDSPRSSPA